ncbi:cupredoxin domain-containing protein [Patescibacteria group bacterium]|nr:cupredoxin domain-containing protein [Patescibacteria group bacterium]
MNKNLLIGLAVLVVLGGGYLLLSRGAGYQAPTTTTPTQQAPEATESAEEEEEGEAMEEEGAMMEAREIVVEGDEFSFSPASISVKVGEKVKLTFNNVGGFPHNFTVQGLGVATKTIGAGETDTIEFTVEEGGTYATFCSVGNHRAQGMEGSLEVE